MARVARQLDPRGDRASYAQFIADVLAGTVTATTLFDETEATGQSRAVVIRYRDEDGNPVVQTVQVPIRRLVTLEYEDPAGRSSRRNQGT